MVNLPLNHPCPAEQKMESWQLFNSFWRIKVYVHTHNNPSAPDEPPFESIVGMPYGIDEVSSFENELGEIVIKTTWGCKLAMANVDSITALANGRYAGGSHIILSSSHITHLLSSLRPIPRRNIEASPTSRDCESLSDIFDSIVPVRNHIHVNRVCVPIQKNTYPSIQNCRNL